MEREKTEDTVVVESIEGKAIDGEGEHGGYRSCGVNKSLSYRWMERENTDDTVIVESIEGRAIDGEGEHGGYRYCGVNRR